MGCGLCKFELVPDFMNLHCSTCDRVTRHCTEEMYSEAGYFSWFVKYCCECKKTGLTDNVCRRRFTDADKVILREWNEQRRQNQRDNKARLCELRKLNKQRQSIKNFQPI
jgi:hypothetical protein